MIPQNIYLKLLKKYTWQPKKITNKIRIDFTKKEPYLYLTFVGHESFVCLFPRSKALKLLAESSGQ